MTEKATVTKTLSDVQVVRSAWKLIKSTDVKDSLPPRHTLRDIWMASRKLQALGLRFLEAYGDRLKDLDQQAHRELISWKENQL
jgi:hypothetical protein